MHTIAAETLPQVVHDHIAAHNNCDPGAFMATLTLDALVNDIQREFHGHSNIRAWADEEIFGPHVTLAIERAFEQSGNMIVRFFLDGDFDKSNLPDPLILTYYFTLRDDLISQLIILRNKSHTL
jgi:hypothetical protein